MLLEELAQGWKDLWMATATPEVRQSWEQAGVAPNPWGVALMKAFREGFLEEMISEKKIHRISTG